MYSLFDSGPERISLDVVVLFAQVYTKFSVEFLIKLLHILVHNSFCLGLGSVLFFKSLAETDHRTDGDEDELAPSSYFFTLLFHGTRTNRRHRCRALHSNPATFYTLDLYGAARRKGQ